MPENGRSGPASVAAIALGSNLGNREASLQTAISEMEKLGRVLAVSRFVDTAPVGFLDQPRFLNGALLLETNLPPLELLYALLEIERRMGRERAGLPAKGPRVIDLDLIFYGNAAMATSELTLPHPAMHERAFVLAPLAEIAPDWIHPLLGESVGELLKEVSG